MLDFATTDASRIGECEFALISQLNSQLIVHHPYRMLAEIRTTFPLTSEEESVAWSVINDHYLTDLPLLYAPHVIAVAAIFMTVALRPSASSSVPLHPPGSNNAGLLPQPSALPASGGSNVGGKGAGAGAGAAEKMQRWIDWAAESEIDMNAVTEAIQEMVSLYEDWEQYNERVCKDQIGRFIKARGLDK
jgi:cyclin C